MGSLQCVWKTTVHGLKAVVLMVVVQAIAACVVVPFKMVLVGGMSISVLVAYRLILTTAFMAPLALIFERKSRPKLTWKVTVQAFLCGLLGGSMFQNLYLEGLVLTSLTYAAATGNLILGITFVFAAFFRLEKWRLGTAVGKSKVVGTLVGIGAAMVLTFYKGPEVRLWEPPINLLKITAAATAGHSAAPRKSSNMVHGFVFAFCSCICSALHAIVQGKMSASYPAPYSSAVLQSFMGAVQAVVYALCREKRWDQWRMGWSIRLFAVLYSGILVFGLNVVLTAWCVRMKGPLFVSFFTPLVVVIVAFVASQTLGDKLNLGSVLGVALIICGFYLVLWGKCNEKKISNQLTPSPTSSGELSSRIQSLEIVTSSPKVNNELLEDGGSSTEVLTGDQGLQLP